MTDHEMENKKTTLVGTTADAQEGAVLVGDDFVVYIHGLEMWPSDVAGKMLRVTGNLHFVEHIDNSDPSMPKAGSVGQQRILRNATWEVIGK